MYALGHRLGERKQLTGTVACVLNALYLKWYAAERRMKVPSKALIEQSQARVN